MKILNLGCGAKTSSSPEVVNIDWSIYLRLKKNPGLQLLAPLFIRGERLKRFSSLPNNIVCHDLSKGIPFSTNSIDAVYHSHVLEHIDRHIAEKFLLEVKRVLKPNGVHRIVVPDLEKRCRDYLAHIDVCEKDPTEAAHHEDFISAIIEQSVRREAYGTSQQPPLRRYLENLILGDARKRGETHQWMYDRISLCELLIDLGYRNPQVHAYNTSQIRNWTKYKLDVDEFGNQYKPESLYIEARK
jgi:predicted SAM-dependent methyltransferase